MTPSLVAIPGLIGTVLHFLVLIGALVLVVTRVRGRPKQLGVAGVAILLVVAVLRPLLNVVVPALALGGGMNTFFVIQSVNLLFTAVDLVGILLLVAALVAGSSEKSAAPGISAGPSGVSGGWGPSSPGPPRR